MTLKKNAVFWSVVLALVLIGAAVLYGFTGNRRTLAPAPEPIDGTYTLEDVQMASTTERCWAAIEDGVYDLTPFVKQDARIITLCGVDATAAVARFGEATVETFSNLRIGSLQR